MKFRIRRHGAFYDIVVDGRKVGGSFRDREVARIVLGWCKRAVAA